MLTSHKPAQEISPLRRGQRVRPEIQLSFDVSIHVAVIKIDQVELGVLSDVKVLQIAKVPQIHLHHTTTCHSCHEYDAAVREHRSERNKSKTYPA